MKERLQIIPDFFTKLARPKGVGSDADVLLEVVNFNALLLTGLFFSIIMTVFSLLELDLFSHIMTISFTLIFGYLYYLSRYRSYQNVSMLVTLVLLLLSICWFVYGGASGSTTYLYILFLFMITVIVKRSQQYLMLFIILLNIAVLLILEYYFGEEWVQAYVSENQYYTDLVFTFVLVLISGFLVMRFLKRVLEAERDKVLQQNVVIEKQRKEHESSLAYAYNLQSSIISNKGQLEQLFENHFVFLKPKDIVSGDFYWVKDKEECSIVVVADCTGHGVPAALLSVLGVSLLERIAASFDSEWTAAYYLEKLRLKFMNQLNQHNSISDTPLKDAIDLGLLIVNYQLLTIQFSGANRSLLIIRDSISDAPEGFLKKEELGDYALYSFDQTRNTIGFNYRETPFVNHTIAYNPGDKIYLFSDGFVDQYNSTDSKKFMIRQFKTTLLKIQDLSMKEQLNRLNQIFDEWKGETEQTDDVLVLGLKL